MQTVKRDCQSLWIAALGFVVLVSPLAAIAAYPERPIRFIVPAAAGNSGDISARIIVAQLSRQMAQQIVVDNRPGASGSIAMEIIAKAPSDGYTIGSGNLLTLALNRSVLPKLPYDPDKLQAVVHYTNVPLLLAVTVSLPVRSVQDLIDHRPQKSGQAAVCVQWKCHNYPCERRIVQGDDGHEYAPRALQRLRGSHHGSDRGTGKPHV